MIRPFITLLVPSLLGLAACAKPATEEESQRSTAATAAAAATPADSPAMKGTPTTVTGKLVIGNPAGGEPIPAASATVYLEGYSDLPVQTTAAGTFQISVPDGAFTGEGAALLGNAVGWYAVGEHDGSKMGVEQPNVTVQQGMVNELGDVTLSATTTIKGRIQADGASSLAGATISIPRTIFKATTEADGSFTLDGVPASVWKMQAEMTGYETMSTDAYTFESGKVHDMGMMGVMQKAAQ